MRPCLTSTDVPWKFNSFNMSLGMKYLIARYEISAPQIFHCPFLQVSNEDIGYNYTLKGTAVIA